MKLNLPDDPYSPAIGQFLMQSFPAQIKGDWFDAIEALTDAIIATGQVRYGPRPSPETTVAIRDVIRHNVTAGLPLRFISPWGSEKPNGTGVDVAELMALKTFICLNDRVKKFYSPGIELRLRIEDVSAPHLFFERKEDARKEAKLYSDGLSNLIEIMGLSWITAARESLFATEEQFNEKADLLLPYFEKHLAYPSDPEPIREIKTFGWSGQGISREIVEHYLKSYVKLYPDAKPDERMHRLARYFAGALARKHLGLDGKGKDWGLNFMEISFTNYPPKPTRIHYRVMPSNITSMHMPPWRAKGYLRVGEDTITASLASFQDEKPYNPFQITVENDGVSQAVQADYIIV